MARQTGHVIDMIPNCCGTDLLVDEGSAVYCQLEAHLLLSILCLPLIGEDLVKALRAIDEVGDLLQLKYSHQPYVIGHFQE